MVQIEHSKSSTFEGPMPSPETLRGYTEICPDAAKQIIQDFIDREIHRREIESKITESEIAAERAKEEYAIKYLQGEFGYRKLVLTLGVILSILLLIGFGVFSYLDKDVIAYGSLAGTVVALIGACVLGRIPPPKDH